MSGNTGKPDPVRQLRTAPLHQEGRGEPATMILQELHDADGTGTAVMRTVPPVPTRWFRDNRPGTPWTAPVSATAVERRVERTGRIQLPADHHLAAVRQEMRMRARDHMAGHSLEGGAGRVLETAAWEAFKRHCAEARAWLRAEHGQDYREEVEESADELSIAREHLRDLDAFGAEKGFPTAVTRSLGARMARHETTPWDALRALSALD